MSVRHFLKVLDPFFGLKHIFLFVCWIQPSSAISGNGDLLVNSTVVCDTCVNLCETSQLNEFLIGDCQRGCRLFDTLFIRNPLFLKFDDAVAFKGCNNLCSEAYGRQISATKACSDGCNNFHINYLIMRQEIEQKLEEAGRSMIMMLFQPYFKSSEKLTTPQVIPVEDFQQIVNTGFDPSLSHAKSRFWRESSTMAPQPTVHSVERLTRLRNFPTPTASPTAPAAGWITPSSVTIFVLGIFVILGLTCFCCINDKHPIDNTTTPKSLVETDPPPSYEQAVAVNEDVGACNM